MASGIKEGGKSYKDLFKIGNNLHLPLKEIQVLIGINVCPARPKPFMVTN